jgi:hypothetical protein
VNVIRSRVALRERALLDVLDLALRFCASHWRAYATLGLLVVAPAFATSCVVAWAGGWWVGWAVTVAMTAFAGAPFVALASRLVFADHVSVLEATRVALRMLPRLAAARAVQAVWLGLSAFLFGLPWLWMGTILLFVVEVLLLEQQTGVGVALGRAQRIARARLGPAIATMLLLAAVPVAAAMVADVAGREVLGSLLEIAPPRSVFREGGSLLAIAGWWSTVPLTSTARFFVYLDIRTRTEGWDIQTRFAAIAARATGQARDRAERTARTQHAVLLVLSLLAIPSLAHATMDPSRARADIDTAMAANDYSFCREPREPLTFRARALCEHATEIPACAGFAAACARADKQGKAASESPPRTLNVPPIVWALARMTVWLLVTAIAVALLVPVVRAIVRARWAAGRAGNDREAGDDREATIVDPPIVATEDSLLLRADDLARRGERAAAIEVYLAAALQSLDRRGAVHIARHRTNGEYLRSCVDTGAKVVLEGIVRDVDRVKFGGEEASADAVSRAARGAQSIVRALPMTLLALTLAFAFGCVGSRVPLTREGDDPAGDELWFEVLRRQGLRVERLGTSLASLPLQDMDERSPAVVVDAERTDLDSETRDHLVAWVDAGGILVLAGAPETWPRAFGIGPAISSAHAVTVRRRGLRPHGARQSAGAPQRDHSALAEEIEHAALASGAALEEPEAAERVASFDDGGTPYAAFVRHGRGFALGIATDELMTNVGLARGKNAGALVAILSKVNRVELRVAQEDDGVAPPTTPMAVLSRAGLDVALAHALAATLVLFLAVGVRMARARPAPPPRDRAFAQHVQAVGGLYARAGAASHALAAYAQFVEERLRGRMLRRRPALQPGLASGATDIASFLASRTNLPVDVCRRLWTRALAAKAATSIPVGDELRILDELSAAYTAATAETV